MCHHETCYLTPQGLIVLKPETEFALFKPVMLYLTLYWIYFGTWLYGAFGSRGHMYTVHTCSAFTCSSVLKKELNAQSSIVNLAAFIAPSELCRTHICKHLEISKNNIWTTKVNKWQLHEIISCYQFKSTEFTNFMAHYRFTDCCIMLALRNNKMIIYVLLLVYLIVYLTIAYVKNVIRQS